VTTPVTPAELQHSDTGLLTIPTATRILGLSINTVRAAVASGEIPTVPIGDRRYVSRSTLLDLLGLPDLVPGAVPA